MKVSDQPEVESLDVQPSTVFKLLGELFSAQSYRENIWNTFQSVYKPNIRKLKVGALGLHR
jgi:hypothetical protein